MTELILVRHTRVKVDKGICYGQADVPLADSYENELPLIKNQLESINVSALYTSPLNRCVRLATDLESVVGHPAIKAAELMELDFGDWEMQNWDQIQDPLLNQWYEQYLSQPATGGESWLDLCHRVESFCQQLVHEHQGESLLIITHAGVIRAAQVLFQGIDGHKAFAQQIPYGAIVRIKL